MRSFGVSPEVEINTFPAYYHFMYNCLFIYHTDWKLKVFMQENQIQQTMIMN